MILSMEQQAAVFLTTALIGLCAGLLYDAFRILRMYIKHRDAVIHIQDTIFWLAVAAFMFYIVLNRHHGEFRGFYFLGAGLGMVIYFAAFSRFILRGARFLIGLLLKILHRVFSVLFAPLFVVLRHLKAPAHKLLAGLKKLLQNLVNYAKIKKVSFGRDLRVILKKI